MTSTTLLLVRHGQAEGNADRRFIGQSDPPLTPLGVDQAAAAAGRLAELRVTAVVSSDLDRARSTVEPIADRLSLDLVTDRRLREISNGDWSELLPAEIEAGWPDLWGRYVGGEDVQRPGGERWVDVQARAVEALHDHANGGVVVVGTHAGVIRTVLLWAIGDSRSAFAGPFGRIDNASISALRLPGPQVLAVNDTGHLQSGLHIDFGSS